MSSHRSARQVLVAVLVGVLVGGGLMAVTPAGAEVSQAVATNWKKIWKKQLQPQADKRYFTKKKSNRRYATKSRSAADAAAAAAGANAATDSKLSGYYTKAQADAKYAPYPSLIKGTYFMTGTAAAAGMEVGADISFGYTLPAAPTVHYVPQGGVPPAGCSGTVEAPDASPGNLCVFEALGNNASNQDIYSASGLPGASRMGALLNANASAAGSVYVYGSWAVRPGAVSGTGSRTSPDVRGGRPTLGR